MLWALTYQLTEPKTVRPAETLAFEGKAEQAVRMRMTTTRMTLMRIVARAFSTNGVNIGLSSVLARDQEVSPGECAIPAD